MKALIYPVVFCAVFFLAACESDNSLQKQALPDVGFIKANINGKDYVYTVVSPQEDDNYIRPGSINLVFLESENSTKYWGINIIHGNTARDINDLPMPFIISGPSLDFSGQLPEAHLGIGNNTVGAYGTVYAQGSTFEHDFTVTLTSVEGNIVRGTFHGKGFGVFKEGEFAVELPLKSW